MVKSAQEKDFEQRITDSIIANLDKEEYSAYNEGLTKLYGDKSYPKADLVLPYGCKKTRWNNYTYVKIIYYAGCDTLQKVYQRYKKVTKISSVDVAIIFRNSSDLLLPQKEIEHFMILTEDDLYSMLDENMSNRNRRTISLLSNDEKYTACKTALNNGDCTLFIGAGVSMSAGLPGWCELLLRIKKLVRDNYASNIDPRMLKQVCDGSTMIIAQYLKVFSKDNKFINCISKALYQGAHGNSELINSIVDLLNSKSETKRRVSSVITYNYDDLLEDVMIRKGEVKPQIIDNVRIPQNRHCLPIYHVHGVIPYYCNENPLSIGHIVLSEEDYHSLYNHPYSWANMRQKHALEQATCIFIGMSMNDPNLRRLLSASKRKTEAPHYAFLQRTKLLSNSLTEKHEETMNRIFLDLGVNVVWYDDHRELPSIINRLIETKH